MCSRLYYMRSIPDAWSGLRSKHRQKAISREDRVGVLEGTKRDFTLARLGCLSSPSREAGWPANTIVPASQPRAQWIKYQSRVEAERLALIHETRPDR